METGLGLDIFLLTMSKFIYETPSLKNVRQPNKIKLIKPS